MSLVVALRTTQSKLVDLRYWLVAVQPQPQSSQVRGVHFAFDRCSYVHGFVGHRLLAKRGVPVNEQLEISTSCAPGSARYSRYGKYFIKLVDAFPLDWAREPASGGGP